jgi:hypothetical protein
MLGVRRFYEPEGEAMKLALTLVCCMYAMAAAPPGLLRQTSVTLITPTDRVVLTENCGMQEPSPACTPTTLPIALATITKGFKSQKLAYTYTVSAGKILGEGADVRWDASGLKPGVYTVSVKVRDRRGGIRTDSRKMTVEICTCIVEAPQ